MRINQIVLTVLTSIYSIFYSNLQNIQYYIMIAITYCVSESTGLALHSYRKLAAHNQADKWRLVVNSTIIYSVNVYTHDIIIAVMHNISFHETWWLKITINTAMHYSDSAPAFQRHTFKLFF